MEKHALHGVIGADFERPPAKLIAQLARHDAAKIADSMAGYGVAHHEIKPLRFDMRLCGPAVTVLTRPGDALYVQKVIEAIRPGDIVVIDAAGYRDVAVIGERLAHYMKLRGATGIVVDGAIRDSLGIVEEGIATFARSQCVRIFGSVGPGAINVPISCGGVAVNPGDIVCGDADGIVIVPRADAQRVADLADVHLANELSRKSEVESGRSITDVFGLQPKLDKWGTTRA
jgi:4-hydroxy-4-methyl-2-oxoglutarate aldolase